MPQRVGAQRPTHLLTPSGKFDFTEGDIACDLAEALGLVLFDWQRWLVRWILATDESGALACQQAIIVVPRQNGKGAILEALELYWLIVAGVKHTIHTAHEADVAAGHMERIEALTSDPEITLPEMRTFKANGKERTKNLDESLVLQYRTRTKTTKRGSSPQRIVLDEAQELQDAHLAALVPAMAAQSVDESKMPQLIFAGSAPLEHSFYMHNLIDKVLETRPPRTLLAMWSGEMDDDPGNVDNWYRFNPSMGLLISESWIRDTEFLVMPIEEFMAERLGVRKRFDASISRPIELEQWDSMIDGDSTPQPTKCRIALDVNPDRTWFTACLAGRRADGLVHGEITKTFRARDEAVEFTEAAAAKLGTRPIVSEASGLAEDLADPDVMKVAEQAAATARLIDSCRGEAPLLRHRGEPSLRKALELAQTKPYGDGGVVWSRRSTSGDISPLTGLTMAFGRLWADDGEPEWFVY